MEYQNINFWTVGSAGDLSIACADFDVPLRCPFVNILELLVIWIESSL